MKTYGGAKQPREKKANGFFPNKNLPHELGKQTGRIDGYGQLLPEQKQKTSTLQEMPPPLANDLPLLFHHANMEKYPIKAVHEAMNLNNGHWRCVKCCRIDGYNSHNAILLAWFILIKCKNLWYARHN